MADRTTISQLERIVARVNKQLGRAPQAYVLLGEPLRPVAQVGNFHIDRAYGKVALCEMYNESGGTRDVLGYCSKAELKEQMFALLEGIELGIKLAEAQAEAAREARAKAEQEVYDGQWVVVDRDNGYFVGAREAEWVPEIAEARHWSARWQAEQFAAGIFSESVQAQPLYKHYAAPLKV